MQNRNLKHNNLGSFYEKKATRWKKYLILMWVEFLVSEWHILPSEKQTSLVHIVFG